MESEFEDLTDCPVCFEPFRDPKKLTCDHTLCTRCVDRIKRGSSIRCPKCNSLSDLKDVKTDFRLIQFLDALTKQAEVFTQAQAEPEIQAAERCEFCRKNPIAHVCLACEQNICKDCKDIHRKAKVSKDHKVISVSEQSSTIKTSLEVEVGRLGRKISEFENSIQAIAEGRSQAKSVETESLKISQDIRQICVAEVNSLFDSFDTRIRDMIKKKVQTFDHEKNNLESKLEEMKRKYNETKGFLNSNPVDIITKGSIFITEIGKYGDTTLVPNFEIGIPSISILQNKAWQASEAATIELNDSQYPKKICTEKNKSWFDTLKKVKVTDWGLLFSGTSEREKAAIKRKLKEIQSQWVDVLSKNSDQDCWPRAICSLVERNNVREKFGAYELRKIPAHLGNDRYTAVLVMFSENQHMPADMIKNPGFVIKLSSGAVREV